jgi:hypothetical protein
MLYPYHRVISKTKTMYNNPGFDNNLKIETITNSPASDQSILSKQGIEQGGLFSILAIYALIAFLTTFILRRWQISALKKTVEKSQQPIPITPPHQSPCHKCRFFNQSFYLGCAVHPSKVLRSEAYNCPDYWSEKSNTFSP